MEVTQIVEELDAEIARLRQVRNLLAGDGSRGSSGGKAVRKHHTMSAEARGRIAAAQRRRWAKQKAAK